MGPHIFYQRQSILSLGSIWKLLFPQNESSSNPFTLSPYRHDAKYGGSRQGGGGGSQTARIVQIPDKGRLVFGRD